MAKGIKILPALLIPAVIAGGVWFAGSRYVKQEEEKFASYEASMPEVELKEVLTKLNQKDYSGMYEASMKLSPSLDSEASYLKRLEEIFADRDVMAMTCDPVSESGDQREYRLIDGDTLLGNLVIVKQGDTWQPAMVLKGNESYTVEVPSRMELKIMDQPIGSEYLVESGKEAANFFQVTDPAVIPFVDIYQFDNLLGKPALNEAEGYSMIQDVLSKHWLLGKTVTDEDLKKKLINAAELIAEYPAMDTSLASVTAVSDTTSAWYKKYVTLQNYWFTAHNKMEISNEHCDAVQQSDDTIVSHIYFDYFADNGEVNRTWHVGYQLTFRNIGGEWKVCGTELCSLINPEQPH
ncbi:MAG: hypothetical protein IKE16_09065 [Solobacterium sp.]|nr:hypothetical protein [Solobacterium sp.]MBR2794782.1 hypothetical protein [Solobacterium sp.]